MKTSTLDNKFSFSRGGQLLSNRIIEDATVLGMGLGVVVALNLLSYIFAKSFWFNHSPSTWSMAILFSGFILAGQAFKAMHDGRSGTDWLLLPASPLEKYLAALVEYIILFPLAAAGVATGLSALFYLIETATGGRGGVIWTPWNLESLKAWGSYAIFALAFLAGSAHFRKAALLKSLAVLVLYGLGIAIVLSLGAWLLFRTSVMASFNAHDGMLSFNGKDIPETAKTALEWIGRLACAVVLPVFSLGYGYLRVFEKEARDAVQ